MVEVIGDVVVVIVETLVDRRWWLRLVMMVERKLGERRMKSCQLGHAQ